jgi:hypothetical protein
LILIPEFLYKHFWIEAVFVGLVCVTLAANKKIVLMTSEGNHLLLCSLVKDIDVCVYVGNYSPTLDEPNFMRTSSVT